MDQIEDSISEHAQSQSNHSSGLQFDVEQAYNINFSEYQPIKQINYLKLVNFKSFSESQYVGPFLNFTCIVGPNGGGKSNVIDGICFVFGIETKSVRSILYKDLMNKKSANQIKQKKTNKNKQALEISVTVGFKLMDSTDIELKRTLDSSNKSHYYIGRANQCQEYEYNLYSIFLQKNQILSDVHNFLMLQGEVDKLLLMKPHELTHIFEMISGSISHKDEYDKLKVQLDEINKKISLNQIELGEFKNKKKKLKQQKVHSDSYQLLVNEIDEITKKIQMFTIMQIDLQIEKYAKSLEQVLKLKEKYEEKKNQLRDQQNESTQQLKTSKQNKKQVEKQIEDQKFQINACKTNKTNYQDIIKFKLENINIMEQNLKRQENELLIKKDYQNKIEKQLIELQKELENLNKEIEIQQKNEYKLTQEQYAEFQQLKNDNLKVTYPLRQQIKVIHTSQRDLDNKILNSQQQLFQFEEIVKNKETNLTEIHKEIELIEDAILHCNDEEKATIQIIEKIMNDKNLKISTKDELLIKKQKKQLMLQEQMKVQQLHQDAENKETLDTDLKRAEIGYKGYVHDLIRAQNDRYDISLKLALGSFQNYLVVDTENNALNLNNVLQDKGIQKNVIILANLSEKQQFLDQNSKIRQKLGNLGILLIDQTSPEKHIQNCDKLQAWLLSGKVVCKSFNEAQQIQKLQLKEINQIITDDAIVIKNTGLIQINDKESLQEKELKQQKNKKFYEKIQLELIEIEQAIELINVEEIEIQIKKQQENQTQIQNKIISLENQQNLLQERLGLIETSLNAQKLQQTPLVEEKNKIEQEKLQLNKKLVEIEKKINSEDKKLQELFGNKYNVNVKKLEQQQNFEQLEILYKKKEKLEENISKTQQDITKNQPQSYLPKIEQIKKQIDYEFNIIQNEEEKIKNIETEIKDKEIELIQKQKELQVINEEVKKIIEQEESFFNIDEMVDISQIIESLHEGYGAEQQQEIEEIQQLKNKLKSYQSVEKEYQYLKNEIEKNLFKKSQSVEQLTIKGIKVPTFKQTTSVLEKKLYQLINFGIIDQIGYDRNQQMVTRDKMFNKIVHVNYTKLLDEICLAFENGSESEEKKEQNSEQQQEIDEENLMEDEEEQQQIDQEQNPNYKLFIDQLSTENFNKLTYEIKKKLEVLGQQEEVKKDTLDEQYLSNFTHSNLTQEIAKDIDKIDEEIRNKNQILSECVEQEKKISQKFGNVKDKRTKIFNNLFIKVKDSISDIYKQLTKNRNNAEAGGEALLYLEDSQVPFNGGIIFSPTPPTKRFVYDVEQLSGGEKTIAGLALMFTINFVQNLRFMLFDEADAHLDKENSLLFLEFLRHCVNNRGIQVVVISHKNSVFENSESLVGVTFFGEKASSSAFSIDLRQKQQ